MTDVDADLAGVVDVSDLDHDLLAHGLNEISLDNGGDQPLADFRP